ncbi:LysR family transcriptional regulator [Ramlibacter sp. MAHUQ-53]|uniref:LysR family transcriptional regulator n=1 Tax=unclassified Ramlibacter TaxID=2617605 RepID=UPI00363593CB
MSLGFSYRHLYYFWVVAREGGMSRAAERLGMAVQTVSTQVRELEADLGCALLKPAGRGVALTEAGLAAMRQADQIFQLGEALPAAVRDAAGAPGVRLAVGIPDGLPKLAVRHLLEPVIHEPHLRLLCHDGEFEDLLGELALHKLDLILADRPAPANPSLKLYTHALGGSAIAWYASRELARTLKAVQRKAGSLAEALAQVPVLLPTGHGVLRDRIDHWFERHGVRPRIAGEFEDSALLKTFGASGLGVFPSATMVDEELHARYGVEQVGPCEGVEEHFFAITWQKKVEHRLVRRLTGPRAA